MVDNSVQHNRGNSGGANTSTATIYNWSTIYDSSNDAYQSVVGVTYNNNGAIYGARDGLYFGAAVVRTYDPDTFQPIDTFTAYQGGIARVSNSGAIYGGTGTATLPAGAGVDFAAGVGSAILINHASGAIEGPVGVYSEATGTKITNAGSIVGHYGIQLEGNAQGTITNTGTVQGDTCGIYIDASGFTIKNSGIIASEGLSIQALKLATIHNQGTIEGSLQVRGTLSNSGHINGNLDFAITGTDADTVSNAGLVLGNVNLGNGNDTYNALGNGQVSGAVIGGSGDDRLTGGAMDDHLHGGIGRDVLKGGGGSDLFEFKQSSETPASQATRDVIVDFLHLSDMIDVSAIDANLGTAGNQTFTFVAAEGASFTAAGQIRFDQVAGATTATDRTILYGNFNGDNTADFSIELKGIVNLTVVDFIF